MTTGTQGQGGTGGYINDDRDTGNVWLAITINKAQGQSLESLESQLLRYARSNSNIPYSAFFSQLLRYARICSNYIDFKNRFKILSQKLILRGFSANKLTWQFKKNIFHYNELINKYQKKISINT